MQDNLKDSLNVCVCLQSEDIAVWLNALPFFTSSPVSENLKEVSALIENALGRCTQMTHGVWHSEVASKHFNLMQSKVGLFSQTVCDLSQAELKTHNTIKSEWSFTAKHITKKNQLSSAHSLSHTDWCYCNK